jgi:hypothetical protein
VISGYDTGLSFRDFWFQSVVTSGANSSAHRFKFSPSGMLRMPGPHHGLEPILSYRFLCRPSLTITLLLGVTESSLWVAPISERGYVPLTRWAQARQIKHIIAQSIRTQTNQHEATLVLLPPQKFSWLMYWNGDSRKSESNELEWTIMV